MSISGLLTKENLGFSMPSSGPLYPKPPYHYTGASLLVFNYVTDAASAAKLLPAQAEIIGTPTAALVFAKYPDCTLGAYDEVVLYLNARFQNRDIKYAAYLYVTTDVAMAAGREMGGFPKKIARIDITGDSKITATIERPTGLCLASAQMTLVKPLQKGMSLDFDYLSLRLIPSPTQDAPPSMLELLETTWSVSNAEIWEATGSCQLSGASTNDPLQMLPIVQYQGCQFIRGDLDVRANATDRSHKM